MSFCALQGRRNSIERDEGWERGRSGKLAGASSHPPAALVWLLRARRWKEVGLGCWRGFASRLYMRERERAARRESVRQEVEVVGLERGIDLQWVRMSAGIDSLPVQWAQGWQNGNIRVHTHRHTEGRVYVHVYTLHHHQAMRNWRLGFCRLENIYYIGGNVTLGFYELNCIVFGWKINVVSC